MNDTRIHDSQSRIYDSQYGELILKRWFDRDTGEIGLDVYIGDIYDAHIGEILCDIDDDETIDEELDELMKRY